MGSTKRALEFRADMLDRVVAAMARELSEWSLSAQQCVLADSSARPSVMDRIVQRVDLLLVSCAAARFWNHVAHLIDFPRGDPTSGVGDMVARHYALKLTGRVPTIVDALLRARVAYDLAILDQFMSAIHRGWRLDLRGRAFQECPAYQADAHVLDAAAEAYGIADAVRAIRAAMRCSPAGRQKPDEAHVLVQCAIREVVRFCEMQRRCLHDTRTHEQCLGAHGCPLKNAIAAFMRAM